MNSFGITPPVMSLMNRKSFLTSGLARSSARHRRQLDHDVAVLALAARLLGVLVVALDVRLADGLAVGHLRLADVGFDVELALHAVDEDVQVQLAHAGDDGLAGFLVGAHAERRIFLRQSAQRHAHLFLVGLGLRFDRHRDDGLREHHALEVMMWSCAHRVSPVVTSFRPTAAAMSPARTSLISLRSLECICRMRPTRSFFDLTGLYTWSPELSTPE
jgi:hypothetical protein